MVRAKLTEKQKAKAKKEQKTQHNNLELLEEVEKV